MQLIFTTYNCGTGYNRYSNDVVGQLYWETVTNCCVTDGVGGGGPQGNAGGAWKISGLLGGVGVDANVGFVVNEVTSRRTAGNQNMVVNMLGWSRGAMTCIKIANALNADNATRTIPVNIFAIDPVPGGSCINNHMWRSIQMTPNIRLCNVVLSQHNRRSLFAPYYPEVLGPFTDVDIMPGDHSTIVEDKAGRSEAHELVKDMAKRFLMARGTRFSNGELLSAQDILKRYSLIAEHFDDYAHFAKGAGKDWEKRFKGERVIRNVNRQECAQMLPVKPQFFLNEHHRIVFQSLFPGLTNELDVTPERAFSKDTYSRWSTELDAMMDQGMVEQARMVLVYYLACQARQGSGASA